MDTMNYKLPTCSISFLCFFSLLIALYLIFLLYIPPTPFFFATHFSLSRKVKVKAYQFCYISQLIREKKIILN